MRERIEALFDVGQSTGAIQTAVMSFGYKHGLPLDVDIVLDCRFLPNPHWVDELRPFNGLDEPVRDYVMAQPATGPFLHLIDRFLELTLPAYVDEGKSYLAIGVGCTGGHHRSVVISEEIAERIAGLGYSVTVNHRDIDR